MELISQPEEFGKGQKETPHVWPPPRILFAGIHLAWVTRKESESEWLAKDNPETNPINIKQETASQSSPPGFSYPTGLCLDIPSQ